MMLRTSSDICGIYRVCICALSVIALGLIRNCIFRWGSGDLVPGLDLGLQFGLPFPFLAQVCIFFPALLAFQIRIKIIKKKTEGNNQTQEPKGKRNRRICKMIYVCMYIYVCIGTINKKGKPAYLRDASFSELFFFYLLAACSVLFGNFLYIFLLLINNMNFELWPPFAISSKTKHVKWVRICHIH